MNQVAKKTNEAKWVYLLLALLIAVIAVPGILPHQARADGTVSDKPGFIQAFNDAVDGDTVRLGADIVLAMDEPGLWSGDHTSIVIDRHITLDCNEKKLTLTNPDDFFKYLFHITGEGRLTLINAQIVQAKTGDGDDEEGIRVVLVRDNEGELEIESAFGDGLKLDSLVVGNHGSTVIKDGTFSMINSLFKHHSDGDVANSGKIVVKAGVFTLHRDFVTTNDLEGEILIERAEIYSEGLKKDGCLVRSNYGLLTIEDGKFEMATQGLVLSNYYEIIVEGGVFTTWGPFLYFNQKEASLSVSEGIFNIGGYPDNAVNPYLFGNLVSDNKGTVEISAGEFNLEQYLNFHNHEPGWIHITGGSFTSDACLMGLNDGMVEIEGGHFYSGGSFMEHNDGKLEIEGDTFEAVGSLIDYNSDESSLKVWGGEFFIFSSDAEPDLISSFISENEGAVEILKGKFNLDNYFIDLNGKTGTILITDGEFISRDWLMHENFGGVTIQDGKFNAMGSLIVFNKEDASFLVEEGYFEVHRKPGHDPDDLRDAGFFSVYNQGLMTISGGGFVLEDGGLLIVNHDRVVLNGGDFEMSLSFIGLNLGDGSVHVFDGDFRVQGVNTNEPLDDPEFGHFIWQNGGSLTVEAGDFDLDHSFVFSNCFLPEEDDEDPFDPSSGNVHIKDANIKESRCLVYDLPFGSRVDIDHCLFNGRDKLIASSFGQLRINGGTYRTEKGPMLGLFSEEGGASDTKISGGFFSSYHEGPGGAIHLGGGQLELTGGKFENRSDMAALFVDRGKSLAPSLTIPHPYVAYPFYWEETEAPLVEILTGGGLTIRTEVSGPGADKEKAFLFKLTLADKPLVHGQHGEMDFKSGVATFSLKHGEGITASNLPAGTAFEIVESGYDPYMVQVNGVAGASANGAIAGRDPAVFAFLNAIPQAGEGDETGDGPGSGGGAGAGGQGTGAAPATGMRLLPGLYGLLPMLAAVLVTTLLVAKRRSLTGK